MKNAEMIRGESCIFAGTDTAQLLFPAKSIQHLYNALTGMEFEANRDYRWAPGNNMIERPAGSRIAFLSDADLHPVESVRYYPDPEANAVPNAGQRNLRFDTRLFFAEHQFEVDYEPLNTDFPAELQITPKLPRFSRMAVLGDSITEGYNASGYLGKSSSRKPYANLVADAVNAELGNFGLKGVSTVYWREVKKKVTAFKPDLIVIAYGMNDLCGMTAKAYVAELDCAVNYFRMQCPAARLVLVSAMSGNPEWEGTPIAASAAFAEALAKYTAKTKITFANLHKVWSWAMARKGFFSLTGNGVNHPNDYGHTFYARTILAALSRR